MRAPVTSSLANGIRCYHYEARLRGLDAERSRE